MAKLQIFLPDAGQIDHDLVEEKITIGRLPDNMLQLEHASVSSHHAEILFEGETYHLHDLNSTNGTFVNGKQVKDAVLQHGDQVRFGVVETIFYSEEVSGDQELPASAITTVETAKVSDRPENFVSSSPLPRNAQSKDPIAMVLMGFAALSILVFAAAVIVIFGMTSPF